MSKPKFTVIALGHAFRDSIECILSALGILQNIKEFLKEENERERPVRSVEGKITGKLIRHYSYKERAFGEETFGQQFCLQRLVAYPETGVPCIVLLLQ